MDPDPALDLESYPNLDSAIILIEIRFLIYFGSGSESGYLDPAHAFIIHDFMGNLILLLAVSGIEMKF